MNLGHEMDHAENNSPRSSMSVAEALRACGFTAISLYEPCKDADGAVELCFHLEVRVQQSGLLSTLLNDGAQFVHGEPRRAIDEVASDLQLLIAKHPHLARIKIPQN